MKRICLFLAICIVLSISVGCSKNQSTGVSPEVDTLKNEETSYPMDENGCADTEFVEEILKKKTEGKKLSEVEEELINFYFLEGDKGMAVVDQHGIGMQKVVLKIYSTKDSGNTWQLLKDDFYVSVGHMDCVFLGDKLLFSNYSAAAEKTSLFLVNTDGEESYMSDEFFAEHEFENFQLQAKLTYCPEEKHVVAFWTDNYNFDEVKYTTFYDENMNLIKSEKS